MKAHIVGGGFGGLAAAGYLILNAKVPGQDIAIYEADERMGGGFFLGGSAQSGYNLPGSVFDSEFRCAFALLDAVPCAWNPPVSVKKEFFTFNEGHLFDSRGHLIDGEGRIVHGPRFGLSWRDGFDLAASGSSFPRGSSRPNFGCAIRRSWGRCRNTARRSCGAT